VIMLWYTIFIKKIFRTDPVKIIFRKLHTIQRVC
jgi:hypothetical protein